MCGIAGWYARRQQHIDPRTVQRQCATIVHRGPDDEGVLVDGDFAFGMRRLAVLDLAGGHQPMTTADGRYSIVFNGEVYNFEELRDELVGAGYVFGTRSDTEVVLQAFAAWGAAAWARLEGMFAVALWDHRERVLHLARDPLGIKPLYWTYQNGGLAFGSELKALGPVPGLAFRPDPRAIDQYFTLGAILAPRSIYQGVFKLEPGTALTCDAQGPPRLHRFWRHTIRPRADLSEDEWIEECRHRLLATVKRHLVADVPIGAFLSGGVDSSAVVAAMSRLAGEPVRSFTIGFQVERFDETDIASRIAEHLGCRHTARRLESDAAGTITARIAAAFDEPFADSSAIPTWFVSSLAREQVTVALSGDGGDELFAGYRRHRTERALAWLKSVPGVSSALRRIGGWIRDGAGGTPRRDHFAKLVRDCAIDSAAERSLAKMALLDDEHRQALYSPAFAAGLPRQCPFALWAAELLPQDLPPNPVDAMLYADTTIWLPDDMLTKVDRASMAHSLEVRVPMLAHRFVEWTGTVPLRHKIRGRTGKYLLRRAITDWLPAGILDRPKQGFAVPVSHWLHGRFGELVLDVWRESGVERSGLFARDAAARALDEHRRGVANRAATLYSLLMFAYWWRDRPCGGGTALI